MTSTVRMGHQGVLGSSWDNSTNWILPEAAQNTLLLVAHSCCRLFLWEALYYYKCVKTHLTFQNLSGEGYVIKLQTIKLSNHGPLYQCYHDYEKLVCNTPGMLKRIIVTTQAILYTELPSFCVMVVTSLVMLSVLV